MLDSLVRVSRRVGGVNDLLGKDKRAAAARLLAIRALENARPVRSQDTRGWKPKPPTSPTAFGPIPTVLAVNWRRNKARQPPAPTRSVIADRSREGETAVKPEPPPDTSKAPPFTTVQFHVLLTLSSKFFSIFHHCTCLLSVSGSYLALRGVYLALWAALPSNPTLERSQHDRSAALRAYHPLWAVATVKLDFDWRLEPWKTLPNATFRTAVAAGDSAMGFSRFTRRY